MSERMNQGKEEEKKDRRNKEGKKGRGDGRKTRVEEGMKNVRKEKQKKIEDK